LFCSLLFSKFVLLIILIDEYLYFIDYLCILADLNPKAYVI